MRHTTKLNQAIACGHCGNLSVRQSTRIRRKAMLLDLSEVRQSQQDDPEREHRWDEMERSWKRRESIAQKLQPLQV